MIELTLYLLKKLLHYNPRTGIFTWKISSKYSCVKIGDIAGCKNKDGYIIIGIDGKNYQAHRLAWFYTYGVWPKDQLDHEDHIRHHNWIDNLREVTHLKNRTPLQLSLSQCS